MSQREQCETCRFWASANLNSADLDDGWCRRHAPSPLIVVGCREDGQASEHVLWPLTLYWEWCGEYQPKPASSA